MVIMSMSININGSGSVLALHMYLRGFRLHVAGLRNNMQAVSSLSHLLSHPSFNHPLLSPKIEAVGTLFLHPIESWDK